MKPGSFDIELLPDTPKAIRDVFQPFGHIMIFEARVDPASMTDADLWANALYIGMLRERPTPYKVAGTHITAWLGDEEGKAWTLYDAGLGPFTHTFLQWLTDLGFNVGANLIKQGVWTATPGAATVTQTFKNVSPRVALDWLCGYFTAQSGTAIEYRLRGKNLLDAGPGSGIFRGGATAPTVIVMPGEGGVEPGGLRGVEPSIFNTAIDANSYTSKIVLVGAAGQGVVGTWGPYFDPFGTIFFQTRLVSSPTTGAGNEVNAANGELAKYPLRQVVTLATNRFAVARDISAGDWIWVYDPRNGLSDETNPVNYRGGVVYPVKLRIFAVNWPVESGMAVYYRSGDLLAGFPVTDLTNWVKFEAPGTTFEVGAPMRGLTVL